MRSVKKWMPSFFRHPAIPPRPTSLRTRILANMLIITQRGNGKLGNKFGQQINKKLVTL